MKIRNDNKMRIDLMISIMDNFDNDDNDDNLIINK